MRVTVEEDRRTTNRVKLRLPEIPYQVAECALGILGVHYMYPGIKGREDWPYNGWNIVATKEHTFPLK